jgi:anaerobic selenocysteine-containing dehydrogenase
MERRTFIKLTAVSGTGAALAGCGVSEPSIIRFVPDETPAPGIAEWKPGVCPLCAGGCGLSVRIMAADVDTVRNGQRGVVRRGVAKKLEGAAAHPVNGGGLCARGQAGIQLTYHPDRLTQPVRRVGSRRDGQFEPITWDQALSELVSRLDTLVTNGQVQSLAILTSGRPSHRQLLFDQFAARFGAPAPISYNLFDEPVVRRANNLSFGHDQLPTIDLARTRLLLSFGADFLGTWNSPVAQMAAYARMRRNATGVRGSFVQVESRMTPTGASADEWLPVPPGTEGALALGLAHVILKEHLTSAPPGRAASLIDGWAAGLPDFTPEKVAAMTGVPAVRIERLARALAGQRPAAAIIGGPALAHTNGLAAALAVNALNALLDSVDQPGGVCFTPRFRASDATRGGPLLSAGSAPPTRGTLQTLASEILSGRHPVDVLLVDGVNPVFAAPPAWRVGEALSRVPFVVSFGSFIDETAALADLILPDHTFLESWVDAVPESGSLVAVASVAPPTMTPLFQTRATPDVLLEVGRTLRRPLGLPWQTFEAMLKASFDTLGPEVWSAAQTQGGWWEDPPAVPPTARPVSARPPAPTQPPGRRIAVSRGVPSFAPPEFDAAAGDFPFHLLPYPSPSFLDGSLAHLPWLQELPDPMTSAMWSAWVELHPQTAERLHIQLGDLVRVESHAGAVEVPAFLSPGIAPDVVAMPVGQGHVTFTRYASGRGANPVSLLAPMVVSGADALAWAATRVKLTRVGPPDGRLVLFSTAGELRERPYEGARR